MAFTILTPKDMKTPFTGNHGDGISRIAKILGKINRMRYNTPATIASQAALILGQIEGAVGHPTAYAVSKVTPGAGESLVIDLQRVRAGVATTLLSASITLDVTTAPAGTRVPFAFDPAKSLVDGDLVQIVTTYTAGTPAMLGATVSFEPTP